MEGEDQRPDERPDERTDFERNVDAWNLPRAPVIVAAPPLDEWPETEGGFEQGSRPVEPPSAA
jgi:hypothetical protein